MFSSAVRIDVALDGDLCLGPSHSDTAKKWQLHVVNA